MSRRILDNRFTNQNDGLTTPLSNETVGLDDALMRPSNNSHRIQVVPFGIELVNPSKGDPPGYTTNGVARDVAFIPSNLFKLTSAPAMPPIDVKCRTFGFDPAETSILWRVVLRHVLCRHWNTGKSQYASGCLVLEDEWQGEARSRSFTVFAPSPSDGLAYTYNAVDGRPMGGNGFVQVAVAVPGSTGYAQDFAHIRVAGRNPSLSEVTTYVEGLLAGRDVNIKRMVLNIFEHESRTRQFSTSAQTRTRVRRSRQDPTRLVFDWPDDPPDFPLATFDCGVGISQYTRVGRQTITAGLAWDWQCNVAKAVNLFLREKLRVSLHAVRRQRPTFSWQDIAWGAYRRYNGSGADAESYANRLSATARGNQVSRTRDLTVAQVIPEIVDVTEPAREAGPPPPWPPPLA